LAATLGRKVGEVMEQHMNNTDISGFALQSNNDNSQDDYENVKMEDNDHEIPTIGINYELNFNNQNDRIAS
jgi:hypothetical protein